MKLSWNWLNTFVDCSGIAPEDLAERLTNAGLEVEGIERTGAAFSGVVVARVVAVNPHPNADKLRLVTVDLGDKTQQVVCGAANVRPDITIAFARLGDTVLNRKDNSRFTLTPATIRGVVSEGMICSIDELGLSEQFSQDEDGIWVLDAELTNPQLGQPLAEALKLPSDVVLDTAPTANRGDWMSVLGVARDVAALLDRPVTLPNVDLSLVVPKTVGEFKVSLANTELCPVYLGAKLSKVAIGPSPAWMQSALAAAGVRSINNVVDITNIIMLLWGQPLHAFDATRLATEGTAIGVRHANAGETLATLDGEVRELSETAVAITANDVPVALAGLMGGESTEIRDDSTELFLEAAVFQPAAIRRSAKSLGMRTEASARFERGVDAAQCRLALAHAIQLLQEYAGSTVDGVVADGQSDFPPLTLTLRLPRIETILGKAVSAAEATAILNRLGFDVVGAGDILTVTVPSYRQGDVTREIDLIEEIARIAGYDDIADALPPMVEPVAASARQRFLTTLHTTLRGLGLQEVMTNSLVGPNFLQTMGVTWPEQTQLRVTNSHSPDHTLLRQTLLPSLLEVAQINTASNIAPLLAAQRPDPALWVYELGRVYQKRGKANTKHSGVVEKRVLAALLLGQPMTGLAPAVATGFYQAKGVVEALLTQFGLTNLVWQSCTDETLLHPGQAATVVDAASKKALGVVGALHPATVQRLKFRQVPVVLELDVEQIYKLWKQLPKAESPAEPSTYPMVTRDVALVAPLNITHGEIVALIEKEATALRGENGDAPELAACHLFDEYRGEHVAEGHRSLAYRLVWHHQEKTLTDVLVQQATDRVKHALSHHYPVTFRA